MSKKKGIKWHEKINWNAFTGITTLFALIATVIISSLQMKKSRDIFEDQIEIDTIYLNKQLNLMKLEMEMTREQFRRSDSLSKINIEVTREAIFHEERKSKQEIIKMLIDHLQNRLNIINVINDDFKSINTKYIDTLHVDSINNKLTKIIYDLKRTISDPMKNLNYYDKILLKEQFPKLFKSLNSYFESNIENSFGHELWFYKIDGNTPKQSLDYTKEERYKVQVKYNDIRNKLNNYTWWTKSMISELKRNFSTN